MTKLNGTQIRAEARKLLEANPSGISWSKLIEAVAALSPETPRNTIHGSLHQLLRAQPDPDIKKISRGLYALEQTPGSVITADGTSPPTGSAGAE